MNDPFLILLVEDNPADVRLTREALADGKVRHELQVVEDECRRWLICAANSPIPGRLAQI